MRQFNIQSYMTRGVTKVVFNALRATAANKREALRSPLFYALNTKGLLKDDHAGGCTLYANRKEVEQIIAAEKKSKRRTHSFAV